MNIKTPIIAIRINNTPDIVGKIQNNLDAKQIKYICGKTWTTDAFYRETPKKIEKRRREGAIIVEMEAAALFAVAGFRNVQLGYLLAGSDDVRIETMPTEEIALTFSGCSGNEFEFTIEGFNPWDRNLKLGLSYDNILVILIAIIAVVIVVFGGFKFFIKKT